MLLLQNHILEDAFFKVRTDQRQVGLITRSIFEDLEFFDAGYSGG